MKTGTEGKRSLLSESAPYVAPLLAFMVFLMTVESYFPDQHYLLYPIKTILVAVILAWHWRALPSLKPSAILLSVAVGAIGVFLWVMLDPWADLPAPPPQKILDAMPAVPVCPDVPLIPRDSRQNDLLASPAG